MRNICIRNEFMNLLLWHNFIFSEKERISSWEEFSLWFDCFTNLVASVFSRFFCFEVVAWDGINQKSLFLVSFKNPSAKKG